MTSPGMHAADDGSFVRSTGGAAARGAMLIALALIIGLLLMAFALDDPPTDLSTATNTGDDVANAEGAGDDDSGDDNGVTVVEPDPEEDDGGTPPATIDDGGTPTETIPPDVEQPPAGEPRPPSEVSVLVANGTGGVGVAGAVSDKLKAQAYIAAVSNAPRAAEAVIYYRIGYDSDARAIAEILGAPLNIIKPAPGDGTIAVAPEAVSDGRLVNANVVVIVGDDNNIPVN